MKQRNAKNARLLGIIFAGPIIFVASILWLKEQSDTVVYIATLLAVVWTLTTAGFLAVRSDRESDEWERGGARFANLWGGMTGSGIVALLLALPPFHDLLVRMAAWISGTGDSEINRQMVIIVFTVGFGAVVLTQAMCTMLFLLFWRKWTQGPSTE